ncbi:hypothetical protein PHLGIDRAFT_124953 [Phlebiopsis gigantea 11061_1 CR5-6]|uniref:RRM domain-containing protein n=1 Tax=Phlebiopsis gigantea (strain 11061_1 CR5-6) TaxID=745531 RepID=A0A0C3S5K8_PHLG1|nr:hypothetical protein PHLGIDRAFT_124953 [Phlebiopsis gigantea 11061_1 CR5-6]
MSNSLGKRKEREEETQETEQKAHGATLFVSNLPYSATSTDIKTLFSDIGPVRTAFVVLEQGTGTSKGVGYVSFAIREDAQLAFDKVNESAEGISLDGRRLRVQWAGSKPHKDERQAGDNSVKKEPKAAKVPKVREPTGPRDPNAIRTVVISGLPASIDAKTLWKKVRKYDGAEKVDWPATVDGREDPASAHALFATPAAAQDAVTKLHAHVFKGALLSVTLKKRLEGLAKAPRKAATASAGPSSSTAVADKKGPAPSRASRLIVRNLPFNVTEQDLRAVFLPYGPIYSIHIPMTEVEPKEEDADEAPSRRAKGYAFVWMLSKKDAEKALEGANGAKVSAGMADGLVRDKQKKKKLRREEAKIKQKERERKAKRREEAVEDEDDEEEENDESGDEEVDAQERVIAVDWALSKDKWEEAKAKLQEEEQAEDEGEVEVKEEEDAEDDSGDEDDSHVGLHEGSDDESDSQPNESEDEEMSVDEDSKPGRPQLPPPETGTTLFVRNVPFEATEDELRAVFRAFGPLRYAKVAYDHETGRSRGTGFVCFWNIEHADKVIEQSEILRRETLGAETSAPKKNPFKLPSLLTADPSASVAQNLVLQGRTLDVIRAVTREEAGKLKEAGERQREKADKRNMYLLREGIIMPNTPAAEGLPQAEVEKRTQSFGARKALLRSNPSLYVSRTRLSIRQLPLFVTERMLKRLAIHAVRTFDAEVKAGSRSGLTEDELIEPPADTEDADAPSGKDKGPRADKKGRSTGVKQAKIVRQQDRVDPTTGKGRSRGYGFLELEKHADALRVLRWANNNPKVGKLFDEWWKEELGDLIKLEKKKEKKEEGRLERLKADLEEGTAKRARGTLIAEFSIENVQVVKRRSAHQQDQRSAPAEPKKVNRRLSLPNVKKEELEKDARQRKKRRVSDTSQPSAKSIQSEKTDQAGNKLGSLIGRKRKERKSKRKS